MFPRRRFVHCSPLEHSKAILCVDFDSCKRFCQRARGPFVVEELMKGGKGPQRQLGLRAAASLS